MKSKSYKSNFSDNCNLVSLKELLGAEEWKLLIHLLSQRETGSDVKFVAEITLKISTSHEGYRQKTQDNKSQ